MVDILIFIVLILVIITVFCTVFVLAKRNKQIKQETNKAIKQMEQRLEQQDRDIRAIADAINIYTTTITGSVEEQVKQNVDLFNEWITGED